ncbi:beat-IIb, partial [Drosophila busckii]
MLLLCCLCLVCDDAHATLRDVNLLPEPPAVRRGQSVTLYCLYELDGAPLYSIKFYRGLMEFYRFTPGEFPHTKVFQYPGIKVDEPSSNGSMVMIRNVGFGLAGNFSCEVTADAPLYSTATAYANVQVTQLPEARPTLLTEHLRYEPGDILRANCSAPPSRPRAELRFTINNIPVSSDDEIQYIRTVENLITARLNLKLQLQSAHFTNAHGNRNLQLHGLAVNTMYMTNALIANAANGHAGNAGGGGGAAVGSLMLRCTAKIGDLYQDYKEIELGTPQKDPVPAR